MPERTHRPTWRAMGRREEAVLDCWSVAREAMNVRFQRSIIVLSAFFSPLVLNYLVPIFFEKAGFLEIVDSDPRRPQTGKLFGVFMYANEFEFVAFFYFCSAVWVGLVLVNYLARLGPNRWSRRMLWGGVGPVICTVFGWQFGVWPTAVWIMSTGLVLFLVQVWAFPRHSSL